MAKVTTIHFIRHGKTQNPEQLIKVRAEGFPLRVDGMIEVKRLGDFLKGHEIAAIFYSPLLRTKQTAMILAENFPQAKLKAEPNLNEWNIKPWVLQPLSAVQKTKVWDVYMNQIMDLNKMKIGEKPDQVLGRMKSILNLILRTYKNKETICVSHEDDIRLLRCFLEKKDPNKYFHKIICSQPSITTFVFGGKKLKQIKYKSFISNQPEYLQ